MERAQAYRLKVTFNNDELRPYLPAGIGIEGGLYKFFGRWYAEETSRSGGGGAKRCEVRRLKDILLVAPTEGIFSHARQAAARHGFSRVEVCFGVLSEGLEAARKFVEGPAG